MEGRPDAGAERADASEADTGAYCIFKAEAAHYGGASAMERPYSDSAP